MRVLAVSSGGGHWVELLRLRPAFDHHEIHFVTVRPDYRTAVAGDGFSTVRDATRWNPVGLVVVAAQLLVILLKVRPDVVVSTGAAPGYFAIRLGKMLGARTVWVDSLANVDELSRAGQMAGKYSDLWLTQWPELASDQGPEYSGKVL